MAKQPEKGEGEKKGFPKKTALALGAAGLFLFIIGIKRRHRLDDEREISIPRGSSRFRERGGDDEDREEREEERA